MEDITNFSSCKYSCIYCGADTWPSGHDLGNGKTICHDCKQKLDTEVDTHDQEGTL